MRQRPVSAELSRTHHPSTCPPVPCPLPTLLHVECAPLQSSPSAGGMSPGPLGGAGRLIYAAPQSIQIHIYIVNTVDCKKVKMVPYQWHTGTQDFILGV